MDGRKDAITGTVDLRYSLIHLLGECTDFKDEQTALQFLLDTQLGVMVVLTPKFHAKLAGKLGSCQSELPTHASVTEARA